MRKLIFWITLAAVCAGSTVARADFIRWVGGDGAIRYHGRIDDSQNPARVQHHSLRLAIDAVLAGREVAAPERLVITCTAEDEKGIPRLEEIISVTFADEGGRTRLSLRATAGGIGPEAEAMLAGMPKGWNQTVSRLGQHLK
jgi:hypothetical protein